MLRFMDWSVVVMGCLLVLLSLGFRPWQQAKIRKGASPRHGAPFISMWLPLLLGLGLIAAKVPKLAGAPFAVVMIADSLNVVLAVTAAVVMVLQAARRAGSGPSAD